jgi:transcriptional regulator with PAS, ATPase and Fis domain
MKKYYEQPSESRQLNVLKHVFNHIDNGAVVINPDGIITHFNQTYGKFLKLDPNAQIGKHITEVVENSRLHIVAKTGKAEINVSHEIQGQTMLVQRIPIKENGRVIAVFGHVLFKSIKDVEKLASQLSKLKSMVRRYKNELSSIRSARYTFDDIIGKSISIKKMKKEALKAGTTSLPVLVSGESGTGKELFAQSIHNASLRKSHPFIRLNCSAIPKDLLESELFGYEGGAFTGAKTAGKPGKFDLAHKGTIFLDEIGDMPLSMQPKLLRVLEEKEFEPIGSSRPKRTDFRLISASNQNLEKMVEEGKFRADLFYRLNVVPLHIPPLRDRVDDIIPLARHLLSQALDAGIFGQTTLDKRTEKLLCMYDWPGNVRELKNVIERALTTCEGNVIIPADLPMYLHQNQTSAALSEGYLLKDVVARAEKAAVLDALKITGFKKVQAAAILGIHRTLLYKKMKRYNIPLSEPVSPENPAYGHV